MKNYILCYVFYLLALQSEIPLFYANDFTNNLKLQIYDQKNFIPSWTNVIAGYKPKSFYLRDPNNFVFIEYKDANSTNTLYKKTFKVWNYSLLYKDYIELVNQTILPP